MLAIGFCSAGVSTYKRITKTQGQIRLTPLIVDSCLARNATTNEMELGCRYTDSDYFLNALHGKSTDHKNRQKILNQLSDDHGVKLLPEERWRLVTRLTRSLVKVLYSLRKDYKKSPPEDLW